MQGVCAMVQSCSLPQQQQGSTPTPLLCVHVLQAMQCFSWLMATATSPRYSTFGAAVCNGVPQQSQLREQAAPMQCVRGCDARYDRQAQGVVSLWRCCNLSGSHGAHMAACWGCCCILAAPVGHGAGAGRHGLWPGPAQPALRSCGGERRGKQKSGRLVQARRACSTQQSLPASLTTCISGTQLHILCLLAVLCR